MKEDQELRFICKLCNKKYPCAKSLGGHMKSHVVFSSSAEFDENHESKMKKISSLCNSGDRVSVKESKFGEFGNGQSSYGLRENPRKTWRAVGKNVISNSSSPPLQFERFCKQCGKGFQSLKALCGHMACHSDRDKRLKDDHSWTSDGRSDSGKEEGEEERLMSTRSSKVTKRRYKKVGLKSTFDECLAYNNNGDSSVSEIDGDEQEELAMCLMLLSRDSGNKCGGVNSVVESSDNSVVLETKSFSIGKKEAAQKEEKKILDMKLKSSDFGVEVARVEYNSDSEYFLDECAKPESDVSIDESRRNAWFGEYNKPYMSMNKGKSYRTQFNRDFPKDNDRYDDDRISQKRSKYECFNCNKTFKSYQALGGHRPCHKRSNAYYESRYESGDDSTNFKHRRTKKPISEKKVKSKKSKGHVCPFCHRVFKNGQALGGHKRSHFIGGHDENRHQSPVVKPDLLDLNLPAPEEDEVDVHDGRFFPW